jgi:hypothetical protein
MTRFLSTSLKAQEPFFRMGLQRLEAANGHPNTDIRLTMEVQQATRAKLLQLGLDPKDTTARELYHVLESQVAQNDIRLTRTLQTLAATHVSAQGDVIAGMVHALQHLPESKRCFAIKPVVVKAQIKKLPPKRAMKRLGYRSVDSLLKNESVVTIMAVAWLSEGITWQQKMLDSYKKLRPSDFETRNMTIQQLTCKKWLTLADDIVGRTKHNLLPFKELGAIVLLPLPATAPKGAVLVSLSLALHQMNEIRACSTFLKLSQVRADFGSVVKTISVSEPQLTSSVLDRPVSWHLIQQYYARVSNHFQEAAFEPHVQLEDMVWHPIENALARIEPSLGFWKHTGHLGMLDGRTPVSLHIVDAAINYCNQLPFEHRLSQYFRSSLWHELLLGYLQHDTVEQSVLQELQPQLATELAIA